MKNTLYYGAVAFVLATSVIVFAARTGAFQSRGRGFVLHQRAYEYGPDRERKLSHSAEIIYSPTGSRLEVIRHERGGVERNLWSVEDGAVYRITKERVIRFLDYSPLGRVKGEPVVVGGIAAVRSQPKRLPADGDYVVTDFAPALHNAVVGMRHFMGGELRYEVETTGLQHGDPRAETLALPQGVPVEHAPSPPNR